MKRASVLNPHCHRRDWLLAMGSMAGALGLSGCGFALRQPPVLQFQTVALTGFAPRSPMAQALRDQLRERVSVLDNPAQAQVVLHATADARERGLVATTAAAQVRELQLRQRLQLRARTPQGRELMPAVELLLTRDMSYSETLALGKAKEEEELYRDMQGDVVRQVMQRLAAIRL